MDKEVGEGDKRLTADRFSYNRHWTLLLPLLLSLVPKGLNKKKKERREIR